MLTMMDQVHGDSNSGVDIVEAGRRMVTGPRV